MWIFTDFGFFSAVSDRKNPRRVVVRGRVKEDMYRLVDRYLEVDRSEIIEDAGTDYKYRVYVDRSKWARVTAQMSEDIDYTNFKNSVHEKLGHERADACYNVWTAMYSIQK